MEIYTNNLIEAFKQYRVEVAQAVAFTHRDYTASGITRERASRVAEARKRLIARIPAKPGEQSVTDKRPAVLASLAPKNANQVAVQGREWAKVEAFLKSGHVLEEAVLNATTVERLAAIADNVEIWAIGEGIKSPEKINGMIFDRLAEVGHPEATSVIAAESLTAAQAAWHDLLNEALTGEHTVDTLNSLKNSDPEGFDAYVAAAQSADPTGDVNRNIRALDGLVVAGTVAV